MDSVILFDVYYTNPSRLSAYAYAYAVCRLDWRVYGLN